MAIDVTVKNVNSSDSDKRFLRLKNDRGIEITISSVARQQPFLPIQSGSFQIK